MPYPLGLSSRYEYVGHGRIELKDVGVAGVAIASTEKEQALKALGFVLQAACDIVGRHPSSLDRNRDIIWDWRSIELSANAYGAFAYAMVNHKSLKYDTQNVSYDWTPIDSHRGTLSVRKECNFQSELTQQLSDVINEVLSKNKLLTSLVRYVELESRIPTPVLTGIVEGLRMPCRCWRYEQSDKGKAEQKEEDEEKDKEEEAWPDDPVQDFVLEVGMGDKTPILSALADSYIKRGTLCVITVKFERYQESDFAWLYSIYRRGKARRSPGQVTTYDMVCDADNVRVIINKEGVVEFPVGLTLFDFVPSRYLKENGVTRKKDKKAVVSLRMGPVALSATRAEVGCWGEGISISRYLGMLEKLL